MYGIKMTVAYEIKFHRYMSGISNNSTFVKTEDK